MAMVTLDELKLIIESVLKEQKAIRKSLRKICADIDDPSGEKAELKAKNNGFNKPLGVSPELRAFLNLGDDEKISRSQVTRKVNEYAETHNLKNGQNLTMDATLKSLLNPPDGVQVTFLNIQKYINPHYVKEPKALKTVPVTDVSVPVTDVSVPGIEKIKKKRPVVAKSA
jgi:upstream activation factor subunit UAF30